MEALVDAVKLILQQDPTVGVKKLVGTLKAQFPGDNTINAKTVKAAKAQANAQLEAEAEQASEVVVQDTSLNAILHSFVVDDATNLSTVAGVRKFLRTEVVSAAAKIAAGAHASVDPYLARAIMSQENSVEIQTSIEFLKHGCSDQYVYFMDFEQLDLNLALKRGPDFNVPKKAFYDKRGSYKEGIGILVKDEFGAEMGLKYQGTSLGVMISSADFCTEACFRGRDAVNDGSATCVYAEVGGPRKMHKKLSIASASTLIVPTLWDDYEDDEVVHNYMGVPPVFVGSRTVLSLADKKIGSVVDMCPFPQLNKVPPSINRPGSYPIHRILQLTAYSETDVYVVFVDPTYGQFNPDAVVEHYRELKEAFPESNSMMCGAPLAFKVGSRETRNIKEMDALVRMWLAKIGDLKFNGYTYGNFSDFRNIHSEYRRAKYEPAVLQGLASKPELNGKPVAHLEYVEEKDRYAVKVEPNDKPFLVKSEKLGFTESCASNLTKFADRCL